MPLPDARHIPPGIHPKLKRERGPMLEAGIRSPANPCLLVHIDNVPLFARQLQLGSGLIN
jgi:hypothetical protein